MKKTKAFVLSYLKYGDSSLIIRCYTKDFGFKSFILKYAFTGRQKKHHLLFVLNEIEITFYPSKDNQLTLIKEIAQGYIFKNNYNNIIKSSILTFIAEILNQALKNEETEDEVLYNFIKDSLVLFDNKEQHFADFHLCFILELSRFIGFHPLNSNENYPYFNLKEGVFSLQSYNFSKEENAILWNLLLNYKFNNEEGNCFTSAQRKKMLDEIITYFDFHLDNFKKPLSLEVLKLLFE